MLASYVVFSKKRASDAKLPITQSRSPSLSQSPNAGVAALIRDIGMVCAAVIAIREALSFRSTGRAVGVYLAIQVLLMPLMLLLVLSGAQPPEQPAP